MTEWLLCKIRCSSGDCPKVLGECWLEQFEIFVSQDGMVRAAMSTAAGMISS